MTLAEIEEQVLQHNPRYLAEFGGVRLGKLAPYIETAVRSLSKRNWISVGHRSQLVSCLRGASIESLGNGSTSYKIAPTIGTPGDRALQSVGLAISSKRPVLCILGNTALSDGTFFEALNVATLKKSPVLFMVLERQTSSMPVSTALSTSIEHIAGALGMTTHLCADTNSLAAQVSAFDGEHGPVLIRVDIS
jgi:TPP-dependent pyruvate/acetoin dehydrogenase alpha subunit